MFNMNILKMSITNHTSGVIDEFKPIILIDNSKHRIIHTPCITAVSYRQL